MDEPSGQFFLKASLTFLYNDKANFIQSQILLLDGDNFIEDPVKILNEVEKFLGLPSYFTTEHFDFSGKKDFPCFKLNNNSGSQCMDKNKARKHPVLNEESLNYLRSHFRPIVTSFEKQTGMKLRLS